MPRKYASDLTSNDVLIINGEDVMIDYLEPHEDRVLIRGYFDSNGDDFTQIVDADFAFRVSVR